MKKFICIALMSMVLFVGCSDKTNTEESTTSEQGQTDGSTGEETGNEATGNEATDEQLDAEYEAYQQRLLEKSDYIPQLEDVKSGDTIAVVTTSMGEIKVKLFPEEAPKTVENFITHAKDGYYDGLLFHRVIADFMNQTGDPLGTGMGGESIWGSAFEDEFSPYMYQFKGALAMANSGPNTNGSQFYIVNATSESLEGYFPYVDSVIEEYGEEGLLYDNTGKIFRTNYSDSVRAEYEEIGGTPHLDYGHTVFGQVIEGMDVVEAINKVETGENDKPVEDVTITGIEITIAQ